MTSTSGAAQFRMPIQVYALTAAAFAIGTSEFVIMGLLPEIATDLGVSIPTAGLLITGYALGVVVGAPVMTLGGRNIERKRLLLALMALFVVGNVIAALSVNYTMLMAARVVASLCHGTFFGVGAVVATTLVPPERRASAISQIFSGLALANILGVPGGTALGTWLGWRATFWGVAGTGLFALAMTALLIKPVAANSSESLADELATLKNPKLWAALATTVFGFGGVFVILTYIAPILREVTGLSPQMEAVGLLVFGLGLTVGTTLGGRLADKSLQRSTVGILAALALIHLVFFWAMFGVVTSFVFMFVWGVAAFATGAPLQTRVVLISPKAPALSSSLNIGAFNLGNAGGAFIGAEMIRAGFGLPSLAVAGALVTVLGVGFAIASG